MTDSASNRIFSCTSASLNMLRGGERLTLNESVTALSSGPLAASAKIAKRFLRFSASLSTLAFLALAFYLSALHLDTSEGLFQRRGKNGE